MKKDYTGQKVGRLTFIKPSEKKKQRTIVWELQCDCGKLVYARPVDVMRAQTHSCGCLATELRQNRRKYAPIISSAREVWTSYKKDGVTFEEFYQLSQKQCHYCGSDPNTTYNKGIRLARKGKNVSPLQLRDGYFTYNGLDRIDSSGLHTLDNIVPCCAYCNTMKMDMSINDFINHIRRIHAHLEAQIAGRTNQDGNGPCPERALNSKMQPQPEA